LDARGGAAAGRKLTLEQDYVPIFAIIDAKAGIAPCPWPGKELF
jgi:hypothetical protein